MKVGIELQTEANEKKNFITMLPINKKNENIWMPSLFNDLFSEEWPMMRTVAMTSPAINVVEDEKQYHVEIAAPGMTKEDFKIHVNDQNELVITMERKNETEDKNNRHGRKYLRHEFSYNHFEQNLLLPDNVDKENISAKMDNGVLNVFLPKMQDTSKKPIKLVEIQ